MSLWYSIIDFLIPFEWVQYDFMKNALLGVLLVTPNVWNSWNYGSK